MAIYFKNVNNYLKNFKNTLYLYIYFPIQKSHGCNQYSKATLKLILTINSAKELVSLGSITHYFPSLNCFAIKTENYYFFVSDQRFQSPVITRTVHNLCRKYVSN